MVTTITLNGNSLTFPVELKPGWYLEYSTDPLQVFDLLVFDENGFIQATLHVSPPLVARQGANEVTFSSVGPFNPAFRVTLRTQGAPLNEKQKGLKAEVKEVKEVKEVVKEVKEIALEGIVGKPLGKEIGKEKDKDAETIESLLGDPPDWLRALSQINERLSAIERGVAEQAAQAATMNNALGVHAARLDVVEQQLGRAFIRPEERPTVGDQVVTAQRRGLLARLFRRGQ